MAATPEQPVRAVHPQRTSSVDKAQLANWRFGETNGFVVKDYTGLKEGEEPVVMVLKSSDIFEFIADAAKRQAKVAIYAIGPCIIDWT